MLCSESTGRASLRLSLLLKILSKIFPAGYFYIDVKYQGASWPWKNEQNRILRLVEGWSYLECDGLCQGYAFQSETNPSFVRVVGFGFNKSETYFCRFFMDDSHEVYSLDAFWVSSALLICNIPEWPFSAGQVWMTVHKNNTAFGEFSLLGSTKLLYFGTSPLNAPPPINYVHLYCNVVV